MGRAIDHIKYGAGLTASAAMRFLKINLGGALATGLSVTAIVLLLVQQEFGGGAGPGHISGAGILAALFTLRPAASILAALILIASPVLLFVLGNKYIVMRAAAKMITDNSEDVIRPLLTKVLSGLRSSSPGLLRRGGDQLKMKLRLLQDIETSGGNKWTRRITAWGLRKADLSTVDLGSDDLSLTDVLRDRILTVLVSSARPSRSFFWWIIGLQWTTVLLVALRLL